jgi:glucarate dehydratase
MRITNIETFTVNVPLTANFTSSLGSRAATTRTVIKVHTDDGIIGLGEGMRGRPTAETVQRLEPLLTGMDPTETERIREKVHMTPFFYGYVGYCALAAIEMACFDILGKATGQPLYRLLGGRYREEVLVTGLLTRGMVRPGEGSLSEQIVREAKALVAQNGVKTLKFKGSHNPQEDADVMFALREALPDVRLRVDPNGAWSLHETLQVGRRLEECNLEWLEDPCSGLEPTAEARRNLRIPFCTNMVAVRVEEIAPAIRLHAVDVIHGDVNKWGGILANKRLAACCEAFGLGMSLHSGGELGIATAAHLHLAVSTPQIQHAIDTMYYLLGDDVVAGPMAKVTGGALRPSERPGLGVELDEEKLAKYVELNRVEGEPAI